MAQAFQQVRIAGIVEETHDTRSFILDVPASMREAFRYRAGQFLTFEVPWNGTPLRRCYSLSSAPETEAWPKVTVKRVEGGRVSNWFHDELSVGDSIRVQPPEGRFVMRSNEDEHGVVLFGGGSGITPVLSILKSALRTTDRRVKLIYANRDEASIIFRDELDLWLREFPERFEVVHHLDAEAGFMTVPAIQEHIRGWEDAEFFVCGPTGYMDAVEKAFEASGIDRGRTRFERFVSPSEKKPEPVPEQRDEDVPESFTMRLDGQSHEVPYKKGLTLLESALEAGHDPPSACKDGFCGACMALLKRGQVKMTSTEAIEKKDIERGWVLPCQARPASRESMELDFDAEY